MSAKILDFEQMRKKRTRLDDKTTIMTEWKSQRNSKREYGERHKIASKVRYGMLNHDILNSFYHFEN